MTHTTTTILLCNWIQSNSHSMLAKSSTESPFSKKLLSADARYPTGRTHWKVYELSHHETPPQQWSGDVQPLNDLYSSFTHNIIVYCCADSFFLTTHYCSNCLSIIPTLLCYFLFRKPFFFRKFKIQKLWTIYHGHSSISTAFVSSEILHPSQPPQCCYGQVGSFLGRNPFAPNLLSSISDLPSNQPHRQPQQRSPLSLS